MSSAKHFACWALISHRVILVPEFSKQGRVAVMELRVAAVLASNLQRCSHSLLPVCQVILERLAARAAIIASAMVQWQVDVVGLAVEGLAAGAAAVHGLRTLFAHALVVQQLTVHAETRGNTEPADAAVGMLAHGHLEAVLAMSAIPH
eukprot:CAMPEP_0181527310 /NCGR_PEP_ID=MMETSP1110-20121109/69939_1 /TAXON_ID=174948 /ORGANISM="Symbiodinium sp., Strain CCMP421" /LENGTH=147 /DNA_ID=CAMNT_0023658185 /DNA_START=100 /DNA_END=543 /DNA_ORIENTATION=+